MKKLFTIALCLLLIASAVALAYAHPGRLDKKGGHNVNTAGHGYPVGSYHYHKGSDRGTAYDANGNVIPKTTDPAAAKPAEAPTQTAKPTLVAKSDVKTTMYERFPVVPDLGFIAGAEPIEVINFTDSAVYLYDADLISSEHLQTFIDKIIYAGFEDRELSNEAAFILESDDLAVIYIRSDIICSVTIGVKADTE